MPCYFNEVVIRADQSSEVSNNLFNMHHLHLLMQETHFEQIVLYVVSAFHHTHRCISCLMHLPSTSTTEQLFAKMDISIQVPANLPALIHCSQALR